MECDEDFTEDEPHWDDKVCTDGLYCKDDYARASQQPQYIPANLAIVIGTRALQTLATRCARNRTSAMGLVVIMFAHTRMSQGGVVVSLWPRENEAVPAAGAGRQRRRAPRLRKWVLAWSAMKTSRKTNPIGMTRCAQTGSIVRTITARASQQSQYIPANLAIVIGTRALQTLATRCARNRTSAMGLVVIMFAHTQMSQGGGVVAEPAGQSGRIASKLASSLVAGSGTARRRP